MGKIKSLLKKSLKSYIFFIIIGLIIGSILAPIAWNSAQPKISVVPISGAINGEKTAQTTQLIEQARKDSEAIVLLTNSAGGGASSSESLYLEVSEVSKEMPVVASIDSIGASGAYQAIVPSDYIYAKPSSIIGSIGVISTTPLDLQPNNLFITTGPNKLTENERDFAYLLETSRRAFINTVYENRGNKIKLSRTEISHAKIYSGPQAVENGIVDEIGSLDKAIKKAADLAGIKNYRVEIKRPSGTTKFLSRTAYISSNADKKRMTNIKYLTGEKRTPHLLMVAPQFVEKNKIKNNRKGQTR